MRIRLNDPAFVPSLLAFLSGSVGCIAERVGDRDVEASLLGSYACEMHDLTLELLVRAWEATHPETIIEVKGRHWRPAALGAGRGGEPAVVTRFRAVWAT